MCTDGGMYHIEYNYSAKFLEKRSGEAKGYYSKLSDLGQSLVRLLAVKIYTIAIMSLALDGTHLQGCTILKF